MLLRFAPASTASDPADEGPAFGPLISEQLDAAPLSKATRFEIEASDWLILVCSPAAITPAMDEAAMIFKAKGRGRRIIVVTTGGEPGASRTPGLERRECLPRALRFAADASGALTDHPVMPDFVDMRPDGLSLADAAARVAARLTGQTAAPFLAADRRRRRRAGLAAGVAAAAAAIAVALSPVLHGDIAALNRAETARAAGLAAHAALDQGRRADAVAALARVFPRDFDFDAPPHAVPDEALSALNRTVLETRALGRRALPLGDVERLVPAPGGAMIATTADGATHLVDLGAAEAVEVYPSRRNAASRVSPDGATLWTARFGDEARNEDGDAYAPLIFENVDLASGALSMTTAVQSLPPTGDARAISPDGGLFAVDIGPGGGDRTLIAVFDRTRQALAGVTTLPAERAVIEFLDPNTLLLTTDPPNIFGAAPGLYLWKLGEDRPRVLRAPGRTPVCPGAHGASRRAIAAELAAGRLPASDWTVTADGGEVALLLPKVGGGSCLLRWDVATGRSAPPLVFERTFRSLEFAQAGGPYALAPEDGDLMLITPTGQTTLAGCAGPARHLGGGGDPLILCENPGGAILHRGYSGQRFWRGPAQPGLTAAAFDPLRQRLVMAGADGRVAVWDAMARGYPVARMSSPARLAQPDRNHVAITTPRGTPAVFDLNGRPRAAADPKLVARIPPAGQPELFALAATGAAGPSETCAPLVAPDVLHRSDSPTGRRVAIETAEGLAVYDRATCLPVARLTARTNGAGLMLVSDDLLWAALPGEVSVFPLTLPPAAALQRLHARAAALRGD